MWILYIVITGLFHWHFASGVVTSGPTIEPPNLVKEGDTVSLNCRAECSNGTCKYSWTGLGLSSSDITKTVSIGNVGRSYANKTYICTVEDLDKVPKKAEKSFDVYYGPDSVKVLAGTAITVTELEQSNNKNLVCQWTGCHPECKIQWSGAVVSTSSKLFVTNTEILRKHEGIYFCNASNGYTTSKTANITITVNYAPAVQLTWNMATNILTCEASGKPSSYDFDEVKQIVGGTVVKRYRASVNGGIGTVALGNKDYQDTGTYECYVSNGIRNLATNMEKQTGSKDIKVEDGPVLVSSLESYNVSKGDPLQVDIFLYSYPPVTEAYFPLDSMNFMCNGPNDDNITLTCQTHGVKIDFHNVLVTTSGQKLTLKFHKIAEENFKTYTVYMNNRNGYIETNVTILPEGAPDVPTKFIKTDSSHESMTFMVETGFFNGGRQTIVIEHKSEGNQSAWSNATYKEAGVEKNKQVTLVVENLDAETMYEFRAFSYNEYDRSAYTEIVKEKTKEAPTPVGLIVGPVVGGIVVVVVVVIVVVFLRRRKQNRDKDAGTSTTENKDLTLAMPTTHGYENHSMPNVYSKEPVTPESPNANIIYENTTLAARNNKTEAQADLAANYDVPPSRALYVNEPIGSNSKATNETDGTDGTIPPYLDLNNPEAVEEAYLDVSESKQLVAQSGNTPRLTKQDTVSDEPYLDMNEVNRMAQDSAKRTVAKESPYYNTQTSETYENTDLGAGKKSKNSEKGYQNIAKLKKQKALTSADETPYSNLSKNGEKGKMENDEDAKDYQNVNKYKKGKVKKQQPSVDSQNDVYVAMDRRANRKSEMSLPDYEAPPPPPHLEEENYMNLQIQTPKR